MSETFASRITRTPRPFEKERAVEVANAFSGLPPEVREVFAATASCSPYLYDLMQKESDWIRQALEAPEHALSSVLAGTSELTLKEMSSGLRQGKRRVALLLALCDLAGVWPLETITRGLSDYADCAVDTALKRLFEAEVNRSKIAGMSADDIDTCGGMFVLSMGKGGAGELNYSSDIDLICLFDDNRIDPDDYFDVRASFIKITRRMCALIGETTAEGYVFRTDLRLRPDAAVTPVCMSADAAERYYESLGRTWERAAYIKARPAAGDLGAGAEFLETLRPFVWRKHLDFAAIQDAHDMRLRIREHKGLGGELSLSGHNVKLGRGGIREIEFFTQTRQLIAGGRDETLRLRGTLEALSALSQKGWVSETDATTLAEHYRAHREVEHRLQMLRDAQTHNLPTTDEEFARLAAFCDKDVDAFKSELRDRFENVHALTEEFFTPPDAEPAETEFGTEIAERWLTYPALRSERAVEIFKRLRPSLMAKLEAAAKPEEALLNFDSFLKGLPAGVQLFSLFEANPNLTSLIVDIASIAPRLSQYLGRNASVLDAVIGGSFFAPWPGEEALSQELGTLLATQPDYEVQLNAVRRWAKEWHFRVGVHLLRGLITAEEAGQHYADIATAVIKCLTPAVVENFASKHGAPPGRGAVVLGMGSLGAERLNALSDLDLIVIYDDQGVDASDGPRPLSTRPYYARLTKALVTAITAPTAEGRLYEVDMRLRPSGRQGPVATSLTGFKSYQLDEAWTWEHLALTRARVIAGPADLEADFEKIRSEVIREKSTNPDILSDVRDMRDRIAQVKAPQGVLDAKIGPGRLQDIELTAQTLALRAGSTARKTVDQIDAGIAAGLIVAEDGEVLKTAQTLLWKLQAVEKLLTDAPIDPATLGQDGRALIVRETGVASFEGLEQDLVAKCDAAHRVIRNILEVAPDEG